MGPGLKLKGQLRKQYYTVSTAFVFLFNQFMPTKRVKDKVPLHFAALDQMRKSEARPATLLPSKFTLATWNIEMGYQHEKLVQDLPTVKADVMLLQEVPVLTWESAPLLANYGNYYVYAPELFSAKRSHRYPLVMRGQLVLSSVTPLDSSMLHLPRVSVFNTHASKQRFRRPVALYTRFQTEKGTIGIYNVHLEVFSTPPGRRLQLREIFEHMDKVKDRYVMIAGDFNNSYGRLELIGIGKATGLVRAKTGRTCGLFKLDHVFHSQNIKMHAKVVKKKSSDHSPIFAQVELL